MASVNALGTIPAGVSIGGTGVTSTTAYGVVCGGTTATAALQNAGAGTAGQWLLSAGASALPAFGVPNSCYAGATADQTITTGTTTIVTMDYEQFDNGGLHSTVTNNSRVTIGQTGVYLCIGYAAFATSAVGERNVYVKKNGSTFPIAAKMTGVLNTGGIPCVAIGLLSLVATDYVELAVIQNSGGDLALKSDSLVGYPTGLTVLRVA